MSATCLVMAEMPSLGAGASSVKHASDSAEGSCSGILVSRDRGYILTHASILLPLLDEEQYLHLTSNQNLNNSFCRDIKFSVLLENPLTPLDSRKEKDKDLLLNVKGKGDSDKKGFCKVKAQLVHTWKAEDFAQCLQKLVPPSDGWHFIDDQNGELTKSDKKDNTDLDEMSTKVHSLLPYFMLLKINASSLSYHSCEGYIADKVDLSVGETIHALGTPFGSLSPEVFMNSVSCGVVCNLAGRHQELILTDARCIAGMEGGLLYRQDDMQRCELIGMIVAPLCWKANEWIGLTVACSLATILNSLHHQTNILIPTTALDYTEEEILEGISPAKHKAPLASSAVCLVQCGTTWGSGLLVYAPGRLIVTCSHVVKFNKNANVSVRFGFDMWMSASVVYCSSESAVFDIALLRITDDDAKLPQARAISIASPVQGTKVCVVGHGCFGEDKGLAASVTQGVVSKVLHHKDKPVLIQSSCAVHAGASGGPLLTTDGSKVLGIVTCNARDKSTGASFPHINMSVPMVTIWPIIRQYILSNNDKVLENLNLQNEYIKGLWNLKTSGIHPSKL